MVSSSKFSRSPSVRTLKSARIQRTSSLPGCRTQACKHTLPVPDVDRVLSPPPTHSVRCGQDRCDSAVRERVDARDCPAERDEAGPCRASRRPPTAAPVGSPRRQGTLPGWRGDPISLSPRCALSPRERRTPRHHPSTCCCMSRRRAHRGSSTAPPPALVRAPWRCRPILEASRGTSRQWTCWRPIVFRACRGARMSQTTTPRAGQGGACQRPGRARDGGCLAAPRRWWRFENSRATRRAGGGRGRSTLSARRWYHVAVEGEAFPPVQHSKARHHRRVGVWWPKAPGCGFQRR